MSSTTTKRACDACHRRKVRCNGSSPCHNCTQASLACTFDKPPQKKGPKGSRAKVISELRKSQELSSVSSKPKNGAALGSPLAAPYLAASFGLLTSELIEICMSSFFETMYPTIPIVPRIRMRQAVMAMHTSVVDYCLVGSLCAFTLIQPGIPSKPTADGQRAGPLRQDPRKGLYIVEEVVRARKGQDYVDSPSTEVVMTTFFLSASFFGLERANAAWFHLKEAITLAQLLHSHEEATYIPGSVDSIMKRRLFWLLWLSERAHSLHKHRPLTLLDTIQFPPPEEDPSESIAITGFNYLINLFRSIDDEFSRRWNTSRSDCSAPWLAGLQRQISDALPPVLKCTDIQEVDLRATQQWLRAIVWQLATASGCLSSTATDASMTFTYPIDVARELCLILGRTPQASMEIHGIGFVEKLFDIACTLTDAMLCLPPVRPSAFEIGPQDYLYQLLSMIAALRGGESRFVSLLQAKIRDTIPEIAPLLFIPPPPSHPDQLVKQEESSGSSSPTNYGSPPQYATHRYPMFDSSPTSPTYTTAPVTMGLPPVSSGGPPLYHILFEDGFARRA